MQPIKRTINDSHPFFDEIMQFCMITDARSCTIGYRLLANQVILLAEEVTRVMKTGVKYHKTIRDVRYLGPMPLRGSEHSVIVQNAQQIYEHMSGILPDQPKNIDYEFFEDDGNARFVKLRQKVGDGWLEGGGTPVREFTTAAAYLLGGGFEKYKDKIVKRLGNDPWEWPIELQFFRHLRNGCFHKNVFNIHPYNGRPGIDSGNPPTWRHLVMKDDASMNGRTAIGNGGFFELVYVIPFLDDMSNHL
ncbi:MAG: hypothetical protein HJJLKODD_00470 [Phycisphaerae bacterium]|nr:hypothetical protein [Phycisphaerae bacterium]